MPNRDILIGILENRPPVFVHVQVIWSRENSNHGREITFRGLAKYRITSVLGFMSSDDGKQVISVEELAHSVISDHPVSRIG